MADDDPKLSIDDLASHTGFLRRVARQLVGEDRVDDLVQDTWVAALENLPRQAEATGPASPRAWLRRLLANRRASSLQREGRRAAREEAVARPEAVSGPAEMQTRLEMVQRVAAAVEGLPEAYRQVVFLRTYEDRKPAEIARHLGVPLETVYSRLRRGKALLRQRLDEEYGGDRGAWSALLLPCCPAPLAPITPHSPLAPVATGTLLMGTKTLLVVSAALAAALAVWFAIPSEEVDVETASSAALEDEVGEQQLRAPQESLSILPVGEPRVAEREVLSPVDSTASGVDDERAALRLTATFAEDGAPVDGAFGRLHAGSLFDRASPDAGVDFVLGEDGGVRIDDLEPGAWRAELYGRASWELFLPKGELTTMALSIEAGVTVHGRVLSHTEEPVEGAEVFLVDGGQAEGPTLALTDDRGRFWLRDLAPWRQQGPYTEVSARADGFTSAGRRDATGPPGSSLELVFRLLGEGGSLSGVVRSEDGKPVAGAVLTFPEHDRRIGTFATKEGESLRPANALALHTDAEGRFATESAPLGEQLVHVWAEGYPERRVQTNVRRGPSDPHTIYLEVGGAVAGTLRDADGEPLDNKSVSAMGFAERRLRYARTDEQGRFLFEGLPPHDARIRARVAGQEEERKVAVVSGRTTEVDITIDYGRLTAEGVLIDAEGKPVPHHNVCIIEPGRSGIWLRSVKTDAAGLFFFDDVPAGDKAFEVRTPAPFDSPPLFVAPWPDTDGLIELVLPAGSRPESSLRFRVLDVDGAPLEGAEYWISHATENWGKNGFSKAGGHAEQGALVAGTYVLSVETAKAVQLYIRDIEVPASGTLDLGDLQLVQGGSLDLRLTCSDPDLRSVDATVVLAPLSGGETVHLSSSAGRLQSQLLVPGEYTARLSGHDVALKTVPVRIDANRVTQLDVTLDPGTYRAFQLTPPLPEKGDSRVELYAPDGTLFMGSHVLTKDQVTIYGLYAGTWRLLVVGADGLEAEVELTVEELSYPTDWIQVERR